MLFLLKHSVNLSSVVSEIFEWKGYLWNNLCFFTNIFFHPQALNVPFCGFQVSTHQVYLRLSYKDMQMFMQILKSLPKQTAWARNNNLNVDETEIPEDMKSWFSSFVSD